MALLTTALVPPILASGFVHRTRLDKILETVSSTKVTLIQAPAGFGKSTLLSQWQSILTASGHPVMWLSLDRHVQHFLTYLMRGLKKTSPELADLLEKNTRALSQPNEEFLTSEQELSAIVDALVQFDKRVFIIIDDVQFIPTEENVLFRRFVNRLPINACLILATRTLPDLPISRMKGRGELLELGLHHLRFTRAEVAEFMASSNHGDLPKQDIDNLLDRTEGWATGLRLAALSMNGQSDTATLIASFSGSKSVVADFFSEDVIAALPQQMQDFLLSTCFLDRLSADLCDAVTGNTDSEEILKNIEDAGLFLIRLDDEARWYRYHSLFGDFLERRATAMDPDAAAEVHRRAAIWNFDHGIISQALDHAERSGDMALAANLLNKCCEELIYDGKLWFVCELADRIGQELVSHHARILLCVAWLRTREMDFVAAQRAIDSAQTHTESQKPHGNDVDFGLLLEHRKIMLAAAEDRFGDVAAWSSKLLAEYENIPAYLTCNLYGQSIRAQRERLRFDQFEHHEAHARRALTSSNHKFAYVAQQAIVGQTYFAQGRNSAAERAFKFGLEQAIDFAGEGSQLAALPALPLALLAYDRNEIDRARELLDVHLPVARRFCFADELLAGIILAPRIKSTSGDFDGAMEALDQSQSIAAEIGLPRLLEGVRHEKVCILLRHFHVDRALQLYTDSTVDVSSLKPVSSNTTIDEMRAATRIRLEMARGNTHDASKVTQRWRTFCHGRGALRSYIQWSLLHAQITAMDGDRRGAQRSLRDALVAATEGHSVRLFLDEGIRVHDLLSDAYGSGPRADQPVDVFAYELLDIFNRHGRSRVAEVSETSEMEPAIESKMTGRELEILTLVAAGLRNREIGDRLGLTEGSVKWYMQRIYDKVGTRRRSLAVERARQFGFLN